MCTDMQHMYAYVCVYKCVYLYRSTSIHTELDLPVSVDMYVYVYARVSISSYADLHLSMTTCLCLCLSIPITIAISSLIYVCMPMPIYPSLSLSLCLSIVSIYLRLSMSIYVYPCLCLAMYVDLCISPSICGSISRSILVYVYLPRSLSNGISETTSGTSILLPGACCGPFNLRPVCCADEGHAGDPSIGDPRMPFGCRPRMPLANSRATGFRPAREERGVEGRRARRRRGARLLGSGGVRDHRAGDARARGVVHHERPAQELGAAQAGDDDGRLQRQDLGVEAQRRPRVLGDEGRVPEVAADRVRAGAAVLGSLGRRRSWYRTRIGPTSTQERLGPGSTPD